MASFLSLLLVNVCLFGVLLTASAQRRWRRHTPVRAYTDECKNNIECPISKFCDQSRGTFDSECAFGFVPCNGTPRRCVPRLGRDEKCTVGGGRCAEGLYCAFLPSGTDPVCRPQFAKGAKCPPSGTYACADGLVCSRRDPFCRDVKNTGGAGARCSVDRNCDQDGGFYCKNVQFPQGPQDFEGTCTKKKATGEACDRASDNFECQGYCLRLSNGTSSDKASVCMDRRNVGQSCSDSTQCRIQTVRRSARVEEAICNVQSKPGSKQGVCIMESKLLRKPGQKCNPAADACDAGRSLRCEKFYGRYVCIQKSKLGGLCTARSYFSFCSVKSAGTRLECRRRLSFTKKIPFGTDVCSRVRETVKRGEICNRAEYAICERGTTCTKGPGIVPQNVGKFPPPPLAYCMKIMPIGADCSGRFTTACAEGSFCINNKCRKADKEPQVLPLLSGLSVQCNSRACAQGLECKTQTGGKFCQLQTMVVGPWRKCSNKPSKTIVCVKGTACRRGLEWAGVKRCRPLGRVGSFCEDDDGCKGDLKCRPPDLNDFLLKRTCYDPKKATALGKWCDPRNSACAVGKEWQRAKCLPKWNSFACQIEATLFQYCSPSENIACAKGLTCSSRSACIPRNETPR